MWLLFSSEANLLKRFDCATASSFFKCQWVCLWSNLIFIFFKFWILGSAYAAGTNASHTDQSSGIILHVHFSIQSSCLKIKSCHDGLRTFWPLGSEMFEYFSNAAGYVSSGVSDHQRPTTWRVTRSSAGLHIVIYCRNEIKGSVKWCRFQFVSLKCKIDCDLMNGEF